jgi:GNAT superfamily N-acetyltransferase
VSGPPDTRAGGLVIRPLDPGDLKAVVDLAAQAFGDSELYAWVAGRDPAEFLAAVFGYRIAVGAAYGETDVAVEGDQIVGAAVWTPPTSFEAGHAAALNLSRSLGPMSVALSRFGEPALWRWTDFFDLFLAARDAVVDQPFWALTPIAVLPGRRGQGVASKLLRPRLALMADRGEKCFLGTQDEHSRDVYLHYGFEIVREDPIPRSNLLSRSMVRRPGPLPPPSGGS